MIKKQLKKLITHVSHSLGYELSLHRVTNTSNNNKPIVFVHIPKCGGISVDRALRSQLALPNERKIKRGPLIASSLFSINKEITSLNDKCDFSEFHCHKIQDILVYHLNLNWQYVSGHFNVTSKILEEFSDKYQFVTLLRDPVERFISNYIFNRLTNDMTIMPPSMSSRQMTKEELWQEADELINSRRGWHMANTMTMFLTGRYPKDEADAKTMQNEVQANLEKFSVVGFLDDMPSFENQLTKVTGQTIEIGKHNTTRALESDGAVFIRISLQEYFQQVKALSSIEILCANESANYYKAKNHFSV
jgi:hypothetical protein